MDTSFTSLRNFRTLVTCIWLLFTVEAYAQEEPVFNVPRDVVGPSPTAAALGTFGGVELKKSTGGVYKSIPLFQLREGAIQYNPTIEYYSTGVRVDEWGGTLGISWSNNLTATIQRTVGTIPDEYSNQRLTEPASQYFQSPATMEKYSQLLAADFNENLANGPNNAFDPEYDIFTFNIFGNSGQFVIVNGEPILLTHSEKTKIEILRTSPTYSFCLKDVNGFKYFFQDDIEYTSLGVDGEVTPQIATTWFIRKIKSPIGDSLMFAYGDMSYAFKSGFYQHVTYKGGAYTGDQLPFSCQGGEVPLPDFNTLSNTYGVSRTQVSTKKLLSVTGTMFKLTFEYLSRQDLPGANLLQKMVLRNKDDVPVSSVQFEYDTYTASSAFQNNWAFVNDDLYPFPFGDGKIRYFLRTVREYGAALSQGKVYSFTYSNPQNLPPRLSLSQDEGGYFNGKANQWFIPKNRIEDYIEMYGNVFSFPMSLTGDRRPSESAKAGILNKILYPTGGSDAIDYELNTYTTTIEGEQTTYWAGEVSNLYSDGYYTASADEQFDWLYCDRAVITLDWDVYDPETGISEQDLLGNHFTWFSLDGSCCGPDYRTFTFNGAPYDSIGLGLSEVEGERPITIVFENNIPGGDIGLRFKMYGRNTRVKYEMSCATTHEYIGDLPVPGLRVKQVLTKSNDSPDMVKEYDYRRFDQQDNRLVYSSAVSSHVLDQTYTYAQRYAAVTSYPGCDACGKLLYDAGYSNSRYQPNVFGGNSIAYSYVTEIQKDAFTASVYDVATDYPGDIVFGDPFFLGPRENTAWNNGLELSRYYGTKTASDYLIRKEQRWQYLSHFSLAVENVDLYQRYSPSVTPFLGCGPAHAYEPFTILSYNLWHARYFQDGFTEVEYAEDGQRTMRRQIDYTYDLDGLVTKELHTTSKNDVVERTIKYPKNINSGAYLAMSQENLLNFPVEETVKLNGSVIGGHLTTYRSENGLFLRDHVYSVAVDGPLNSFSEFDGTTMDPHYGATPEAEYLTYNSTGRVTKTGNKRGVYTYYVWGYNNNYPVARIESPNSIAIAVSVNDNSLSNSDALLSVKNDVSYLRSLLSAYLNDSEYRVTLYTYMPLVGMTSQTDPNGVTVYYEYDDLGRLVTARDKDDNIVRIHEYSYSGNQPNPALNYVRTKNIQVEGLFSPTQASSWGADKIRQSTSYFDGLGRAFQQVVKQGSPSFKDVVIQKMYDQFGRDSIAFLPYADGSTGSYKIDALRDPSDDTDMSPLERYRTGEQYQFYQTGGELSQDQYPYARTVFEPNPLNRIAKQGAPGQGWQPTEDIADLSDKSIKMRYDLNQTEEVVMFRYDPSSGEIDPTDNGSLRYYLPNQLQVHRSYDEHNNQVVKFVDKQGLTVLKRVQYETDDSGSGGPTPVYADTYYIYDELSNLVVVLPPEAVRQILAPFTN